MKFDLHTHHERCGHASDGIRDYIEAALHAGLDVIGISDHSPYFGEKEDRAYPEVAMAKSEFPNYVAEVLNLKAEYEGKIDVLLGVESDFFPEHSELYRSVYKQYPFDYIIGSVHKVDDASIFNRRRWRDISDTRLLELKEMYYDLIKQSAKSGMFQILGHIDAMKAYYPVFAHVPTPVVDETLRVIAECGIAIEINTSGKTKDVGGWYPSDDILERALYFGVEVTLGSDAHVPSRVGDDLELVRALLKKIGFTEWVYYKQLKKHIVKL